MANSRLAAARGVEKQKGGAIRGAARALIFLSACLLASGRCSYAETTSPDSSQATYCYLDALDALYEYFCAAEVGVEASVPRVELEIGNSCQPPLWTRLVLAAGSSWTPSASGSGSAATTVSGFSSLPTAFATAVKCSKELMRIRPIEDLMWIATGRGDPVDLVSGANHQTFKDLDVSAPRFDLSLAFERYYNSQNVRAGALGKSWSHSFESSVRTLGKSAYVYKDPSDGRMYKVGDDSAQDSVELLAAGSGRKIFVSSGGVYVEQIPVDGSTITANMDGTYDWKRSDYSVHHFNPAGQLVSITDRNEQTITLAYADGRLAGVSDPAGRVLYQFVYNSSGTLSSVTDLAGRAVNYYYTNGLLTRVSALNGDTLFEYGGDSGDLLTARSDPTGARTTWTYSPVASEENIRGGTSYLTGDGCQMVAANLVTGVDLSSAADVNASVMASWYGSTGPVFGQGASTEPFLTADLSQFECGSSGLNTSGGYTLLKSPVSSAQSLASPRNKVLTLSEQGTSNGFTASYYYDVGRSTDVVVVQDNRGRTSIYERAQAGSLKHLSGMSNPLGQSARMGYDSAGRVAWAGGTQGESYQFGYDGAGNVNRLTDSLGNAVLLEYGAGTDAPSRLTNTRGYATGFGYDAKGRRTAVTNALGKTMTFAYNAQGQISAVTDFMGYETQMAYDVYGRMTSVTDALGRQTSYAYDALGRVTALTSAGNRSTAFAYSGRDEVVSMTDPLSQILNFSYRPADSRMTQVSDERANSTQFSYDAEGRLLGETNPLGQHQSVTYDDLGRLTKTVMKDGGSREILYDERDRPVSILLADEQVNYAYDDAARTESAENGEAGVEMRFDALGRISAMRQSDKSDNTAYEIYYAYDGEGNRTAMLTPFGNFSYAYDALNNLASITNFKNQTITFAYDDNSRLTQMTYPNGVATAYAYDSASQLAGIEAARAGVVIASHSYAYNLDGEIVSVGDISGTHNFGYDPVGRLAAVSHPTSTVLAYKDEYYAYDAASNRTASHRRTSSVYDAANRLLSDSSFTYTYDGRGNMSSRTETASGNKTMFTYNARNLLSSAEDQAAGRRTAYRYDPLGRRLRKIITLGQTSQTWKYFYDGPEILAVSVRDKDAAGNTTTRDIVFTNGLAIDRPLILHGGSDYFYHADRAGSIAALTNGAGQAVERAEYESFGKTVFLDAAGGGTRPVSAITGNPFAFQGRELDGETGLYHYRARTLDPALGRFLQEDPVWKSNRYLYARNNPLSLADPMGADECEAWNTGAHAVGDISKLFLRLGGMAANSKPNTLMVRLSETPPRRVSDVKLIHFAHVKTGNAFTEKKSSFDAAGRITGVIFAVNMVGGMLDPYAAAARQDISLAEASQLSAISGVSSVAGFVLTKNPIGFFVNIPLGYVSKGGIKGILERWMVYDTGNRSAYKRMRIGRCGN